MRKLNSFRTVHNQILGSNPYASRHQVEKVEKNILTINRDDWDSEYHDLYIHKTGNNVNEKKKTCVFSVKELGSYIQKNAEAERENLAHLKDLDELEICYDGDGGGGRFVCEFAFINNIDRKITLHPFLIYEGTDCRENLEVTLGKLTPQFKQIEGEEGGGVVVGGPEVGRPALEVGGAGAYLRVVNENFAIVQKNCSLLKRI